MPNAYPNTHTHTRRDPTAMESYPVFAGSRNAVVHYSLHLKIMLQIVPTSPYSGPTTFALQCANKAICPDDTRPACTRTTAFPPLMSRDENSLPKKSVKKSVKSIPWPRLAPRLVNNQKSPGFVLSIGPMFRGTPRTAGDTGGARAVCKTFHHALLRSGEAVSGKCRARGHTKETGTRVEERVEVSISKL